MATGSEDDGVAASIGEKPNRKGLLELSGVLLRTSGRPPSIGIHRQHFKQAPPEGHKWKTTSNIFMNNSNIYI